jgi:hypothetical protein
MSTTPGLTFTTSDGRYYTGKTPQDGNNILLIRARNLEIVNRTNRFSQQ